MLDEGLRLNIRRARDYIHLDGRRLFEKVYTRFPITVVYNVCGLNRIPM